MLIENCVILFCLYHGNCILSSSIQFIHNNDSREIGINVELASALQQECCGRHSKYKTLEMCGFCLANTLNRKGKNRKKNDFSFEFYLVEVYVCLSLKLRLMRCLA